uniref:Uncharacterized protein n=1 Tax=Oryza glumipatula TaxID=40148 RepID=A0A0E0AZR9_9ORYZ
MTIHAPTTLRPTPVFTDRSRNLDDVVALGYPDLGSTTMTGARRSLPTASTGFPSAVAASSSSHPPPAGPCRSAPPKLPRRRSADLVGRSVLSHRPPSPCNPLPVVDMVAASMAPQRWSVVAMAVRATGSVRSGPHLRLPAWTSLARSTNLVAQLKNSMSA